MIKGFMAGKRILTLALSATMILGEASVSFAATKNIISRDSVIETTEETFVTGAAALGKVTNLHFEGYDATGVPTKSTVKWDAVQGASVYELRITDTSGKEYVRSLNGYDSTKKNYKSINYRTTNSISCNVKSVYYYQIETQNGGYVYSLDKDGNKIRMKNGADYKLQVRAVHQGNTAIYGAWSDAFSFTTAKAETLEKPTDIHIAEITDGEYSILFNYSNSTEMEIKDASGNQYYADVYTDASGKVIYQYSYVSSPYDFDDIYAYLYEKEGNGTSYTVKKDAHGNAIKAFNVGETYTVRIRSYIYDDKNNKKTTDWSAPITVKVPDRPKPDKPGNFEYDINDNEVRWNSISNADGYSFEFKDSKGNLYISEWGGQLIGLHNYLDLDTLRQVTKLGDDSYRFNKDANGNYIYAGEAGKTYTVKVRAYNRSRKYDYNKDDYQIQYSDWSNEFKITVPSKKEVKIQKVTGLRYNNESLGWASQDDTTGMSDVQYELEIKDSKGRAYNLIKTENGKQVLGNFITTKNSIDRSTNIYTYVKIDDEYDRLIRSDASTIKMFDQGETYTVKVRMLADVEKTDGSGSETKTGAWSDAYTFTVPTKDVASGYNSKPGKVTGLWVKDEPSEDSTLYNPILYWNKLDKAGRYEVEVKDAVGNVYVSSAYMVDGTLYYDYYDTTSNSAELRSMATMESYTKKNGEAVTTLRDKNGNIAYPFIDGQTYTFRVRAINRYTSKKVDGTWSPVVEYVGEWSDPVTYKAVNSSLKVAGLKYVKSDEDYYYFDLNADSKYSGLYYQIATDNSFGEGTIVSSWKEIYSKELEDGVYKFVIGKNDYDLKPSQTYYVRVVNSKNIIYDHMDKKTYDAIISTAAVTSFKTDAEEKNAAKNITGLEMYKEDSSSYYFRFKAVLKSEDEDYYEVQINNKNNASDGNWACIADKGNSSSFSIYKSSLLEGANYIRVCAYVYQKDEKTGKNVKVYGNPSNVITLNKNSKTTTAIGTISLLKENDDSYIFTYSGDARLDEKIELRYSTSSTFDTNRKDDVDGTTYTLSTNKNKQFSISKGYIKPGRTYYIKARVYNSSATSTEAKYSAYSNVIKLIPALHKVSIYDTVVTKNSIQLRMRAFGSYWMSGYEVQRRSGSGKNTSWKTLSKSSSGVYTNKKLKAYKTYAYRVRPYYYDKDTKKTTYGPWVYKEVMTGWSGTLNLKAKAASKTSVKLSWNKIKGAKGYEVYRVVANSAADKYTDGYSNKYVSYKLVKTLGSGKKAYTDKNLINGADYQYVVKAYKKVGKKKVYIEGSASVSLDFYLQMINKVTNSNGKVKVTWNPVMSSKGYKIEKKDPNSGKWSLYKTIKKAKTSSYTFPATKDMTNGDEYRISAFNGKKITNYITVDVSPVIAAPAKVTAKVSGKKITVSWSKVSGADYYRVFRSTQPYASYNKNSKTYSYYDYIEVGTYIADSSTVSGYRKKKVEEMNTTSITDEKLTYTKNGIANQTFYAGPTTGVKYYYFVVAYKNKPQYGYVVESDSNYYYSSGASKAASATIKETKPAKPVLAKLSSKKKTVSVVIKGSVKADGYEVYRSTKKKSGFKMIGEAKGASVTYKDKYNKKKNKLKKNKTYYYKVRSYVYNEDGSKVYSSYSTVKKVKFK